MDKKTIIITGGNSGLGYECARVLAADPQYVVVIASRDLASSQKAIKEISQETKNESLFALPLELAALASVRKFVAEFLSLKLPSVKAIICNAGIQIVSGLSYSADGYEKTFAINHLGHFLLINLLLGQVSPAGRIIFVSSGTHDPQQRTGLPPPKFPDAYALAWPEKQPSFKSGNVGNTGRQAYTNSKLCNIFCAYELSRRLSNEANRDRFGTITVTAFDPGLMPGTGLARDYSAIEKLAWKYIVPIFRLFMRNVHTVQESGQSLARLAIDPALDKVTGKYFEGNKEIPSSDESYDLVKATDLWNKSLELSKLDNSECLLK